MWLEAHQEPLGRGGGRVAHRVPDSDLVIKKALTADNVGANWTEIIISQYVHHGESLAQIFKWSLSGTYLVTEFLEDISEDEDLFAAWKVVPKWVDDRLKKSNFGRVPGTTTIKARDYSTLSQNHKIGAPPPHSLLDGAWSTIEE